jgi:outer membrane protein OmpA-like peptidoglycan-associated protein
MRRQALAHARLGRRSVDGICIRYHGQDLSKVAVLLKSYGNQAIAIAGHTDSVGRPEANQLLSENRATAVKEWLTSQGGVPAEGRQKNRRGEIRIQKE